MYSSSLSLIPLIGATVFQTGLGMLWFGKIWGKQWMQYMEFAKHTAEEKREIEKHMPKLYMGQMVATVIANAMLAIFISALPGSDPYSVALMLWIGFVLTSFMTATIWSQTKARYIPSQIAIASSYQLISMLVSAWMITHLG